MGRMVKIFDTTLRDGEQSPGCSMNLHEKVAIAEQLEKLGVDVIEAGFAVSSPGDFAAIEAVASKIKSCQVAALARATVKDIDTALESLRHAVSPRIHTFIATSHIHMMHKLRMSREQVLTHVADAVSYAKKHVTNVEFSAEDASRSDPDFLVDVCRTAIHHGATVINIPDTVGYITPLEIIGLVTYLRIHIPEFEEVDLSVHCHNDLGLAVANSLAAIVAGANQIECTINGIGERAGNAALEELVMALSTRHAYYNASHNILTPLLLETSRLVEFITGVKVPPNKAIVGENAFSHAAGIHQHGMIAARETYEIMSPEQVGWSRTNLVIGKHSGRHAFANHLRALGYHLSDEELSHSFNCFKALSDLKKKVSDQEIATIIADCGHTKSAPQEVSHATQDRHL